MNGRGLLAVSTSEKEMGHSFTYRGWNVTVSLNRTDAGDVSGHAVLRGNHGEQHRIVLDRSCQIGASALGALASKARAFVDSRPQ